MVFHFFCCKLGNLAKGRKSTWKLRVLYTLRGANLHRMRTAQGRWFAFGRPLQILQAGPPTEVQAQGPSSFLPSDDSGNRVGTTNAAVLSAQIKACALGYELCCAVWWVA